MLGTLSWREAGLSDTPFSPQELFKQVLPHRCLGSVWPPKHKHGRQHRASTVSATISQYISLVNCVITTCLGDPSMVARDRARVVEHWIKVAQVCDGRPRGVPLWSLKKCLSCFTGSQD